MGFLTPAFLLGYIRCVANDWPVRIGEETHQRLVALVEKVRREGWRSVGASREDAATKGAIIDEALRALAERRRADEKKWQDGRGAAERGVGTAERIKRAR